MWAEILTGVIAGGVCYLALTMKDAEVSSSTGGGGMPDPKKKKRRKGRDDDFDDDDASGGTPNTKNLRPTNWK